MQHRGFLLSYDVPLGQTRVDLGMHSTASRGLFGFGILRCDTCRGRWGPHGCPQREPDFQAYLQVSTAADRAEDLDHNGHLFTTLEHSLIAEIDQRHQKARDKARQECFWGAPYPDKPVGGSEESRTGTHEIIRPVAGAVPAHSQWAPAFPMERAMA